ncbi:MAG: CPBP family intramembrane metalloprotease [Bacteroidetes bacterium]|nr:CPBP family intramembrane metalloprotease [Bacteroidota bacterium]
METQTREHRDRIQPTLRVILFIIAFLGLSVVIGMFGVAAGTTAGLYLSMISLIIPIGLVILFRRLWDKKTVQSLGLDFDKGWIVDSAVGFGTAFLLVTLMFGVQYAGGWLKYSFHFGLSVFNVFFLLTFLFVLAGALGAAVSEELVFRGYLLTNIVEGWGIIAAIIVTSLLFGFAHIFNPNFSWMIGLNLSLAGLLLAYGYFVTGSLWFPICFHLAWNMFEGYIYGLPVSGLNPGMISFIISKISGPAWLTGGVFGPEGGLISTFTYMIGFLLIWFLYTKVFTGRLEKDA